MPIAAVYSWLTVAFLFILGTIVGSFLDVWARRLLIDKRPTGRSKCEHCDHILEAGDLIPLLSFILLRGRCRYCNRKLGWEYPLVELAAGILFAGIWFVLPSSGNLILLGGYWLALAASCSALIVVFITDFKEQVIFDQTILVAAYGTFLYRLLLVVAHYPLVNILYDLAAALGAFAFFWLIRFVTKGKGMGAGDAPLAFAAGLLVGYHLVLVLLFTAFTIGGAFGTVLVILKLRHLKDKIAFGPFLVAAAFFTIFFGERLLDWYLGILGL